MLRTHTCGELRAKHVGEQVVLAGWVHTVRNHGGVTFIDLRDRYGITQVVIRKEITLSRESVIRVFGEVCLKPEANKKLATGEIEVKADDYELISKAKPLPLDDNATEETRLKYRYLDLRRFELQKKFLLRAKVANEVRNYLVKHDFIEVETPMLVKSTPEGARDYVVPSRVNKGKFYALPQSPQLYKQILMIAGFDKYFQIARCLRDEDLRADRQPEHTQIDLEMSFVSSEDVLNFVEGMIKHVFRTCIGVELDDFKRFTYEESMSRFGSDKPDIRFGYELIDITSAAKKSEAEFLKKADSVLAIVLDKPISRKQIDQLVEVAKTHHAKGLAYVKVSDEGLESGISNLIAGAADELLAITNAKPGDTILLVADEKRIAQKALGQVRLKIRDLYGLVLNDDFKFSWITDFPLFSYNQEEGKYEPEHHMFTMPKKEFINDFETRPDEVLGDLYDLALNGYELGSGSIRVTDPDLQRRIMEFVGISLEEAKDKFGFLLEAYEYGGPIHGGIAIGLDRLVALMTGTGDIREVIAFPKNKNAQCPMDGSPSEISQYQLDELNIEVKK